MSKRRRSRELALQMLFQIDAVQASPDEVVETFWEYRSADQETRRFADALVQAFLARSQEIDGLIADQAQHWRLERMASVDRNVLRLAVGELLSQETPPAVVMDEAIEISRRFSTADSPEFVNGILDGVCQAIQMEGEGRQRGESPES